MSTPFLSMEYVDGEDLATLLQRIGRLQAAHDKGAIHRDLKPQNIMLNKKGEVLILDFGLAAIAGQIAGAEVRNGTPVDMSPEQLKGTGVSARRPPTALAASSGGTEGLAPRYAMACRALVLTGLVAVPWLRHVQVAMLRAPAEYAPEVLAQKARDTAARLGYAQRPGDRDLWSVERPEMLAHLRTLAAPEWDKWLTGEGRGLVCYREALAPLVAEPLGDLSAKNPAPVEPGMVQVDLDSGGRLRYFRGVPYEIGE